ncbi:MAG: helix-hairpin-helix domain-containing protein [Thermoanaerobaculia bacterium]|nr:MAG: helix-hairpin-helix domain-containing protein [Thermoanaerobaculia bacterium]
MTLVRHRLTALAATLALVLAALPAAAADAPAGVINLNTASVAELERLPGVGAAVAQRIVEHREKNGAFRAIEDLMLVRGIGEKSFEKLRPYLTVSGATTLKQNVPSPRPATKSGAGAAARD